MGALKSKFFFGAIYSFQNFENIFIQETCMNKKKLGKSMHDIQ